MIFLAILLIVKLFHSHQFIEEAIASNYTLVLPYASTKKLA